MNAVNIPIFVAGHVIGMVLVVVALALYQFWKSTKPGRAATKLAAKREREANRRRRNRERVGGYILNQLTERLVKFWEGGIRVKVKNCGLYYAVWVCHDDNTLATLTIPNYEHLPQDPLIAEYRIGGFACREYSTKDSDVKAVIEDVESRTTAFVATLPS